MAKNGQKWAPIKKPNGPFDRGRYAISKNGLTFVPRPKMAEMAPNHVLNLASKYDRQMDGR